MKAIWPVGFVLFACVLASARATPTAVRAGGFDGIVYVDASAKGANNGTSWVDAYESLQSGLVAADSGDEVWVAEGTYVPSTPAGSGATFTMRNGVSLYGGFSGFETLRGQRRLEEDALPVLSGEVGTVFRGDNLYHVVTFPDGVAATLDGFIIERGYADSGSGDFSGPGIRVFGEGSLIQNVVVQENWAGLDGPGLWVSGGQVTVRDAVFRDNVGDDITSVNSETWLDRVSIEDSSDRAIQANGVGGFIQAVNVTITGTPAASGAVWARSAADVFLNNTTITGYTGPTAATLRQEGSASSQLLARNVILWGNTASVAEVIEDGSVSIIAGIVEGGCPAAPVACLAVSGADPLLQLPAADHGGFIPTIAIPPSSPAVDSASGGVFCPALDGRKGNRPWDGDGNGSPGCDMGAYEYIAVPSVRFADTPTVFGEADDDLLLAVELSHAYPEQVSFRYRLVAGTAARGTDFEMPANPATGAIAPGTTSVVLPHDIVHDALDEPDETATFHLEDPENATLGAKTTRKVTIEDDDATPELSFVAASSNALEARPRVVMAKLSAASGQDVSAVVGTTGGTAQDGVDYQVGTRLIIPAGVTTGRVPLDILNDWVPEPDETIVIVLTQAHGATLAGPGEHTYTITNDDRVRFCQGKTVTIYGTPGKDRIAGTPKVDVIDGLGGDDTIRGAGANDVICGSGGKDVLRGGPGNDTLDGGNGGDSAFGGGGNDTLLGKGGGDTLRGELGRDRLSGGSGKPDLCDGGPSTDMLLTAHGCESVVGVP